MIFDFGFYQTFGRKEGKVVGEMIFLGMAIVHNHVIFSLLSLNF